MQDLSSVVPAPHFAARATMGHDLIEIWNPGEIFFQKLSIQNPPWNRFRQRLRPRQDFFKLPKVIQVQWKLQKGKDFYALIYGSFNQNRHSLLSNVVGGGGDKCRRLLMTRWRCRSK